MRRWHFSPLFPLSHTRGMLHGFFGVFFFPPSSCHYRGRCQYLGLASLLAVKTQSGFGDSLGWTRKCRSRKGWSPSEERKVVHLEIFFFFFVPFLQQQIGKSTPALAVTLRYNGPVFWGVGRVWFFSASPLLPPPPPATVCATAGF